MNLIILGKTVLDILQRSGLMSRFDDYGATDPQADLDSISCKTGYHQDIDEKFTHSVDKRKWRRWGTKVESVARELIQSEYIFYRPMPIAIIRSSKSRRATISSTWTIPNQICIARNLVDTKHHPSQ